MEKANKQLSDIFDEVIETEVISNRSKENFKKDFGDKYMDYIKSQTLKDSVNTLLTDLYSKKKEIDLDICKKMHEEAELEEKLKNTTLKRIRLLRNLEFYN